MHGPHEGLPWEGQQLPGLLRFTREQPGRVQMKRVVRHAQGLSTHLALTCLMHCGRQRKGLT